MNTPPPPPPPCPDPHRGTEATEELTLAVDIGGTKISAGLVADDGTVHAAALRPTPRPSGLSPHRRPTAVMDAVDAVLADLARTPLWHRVTRCGVCSAGPLDTAAGAVSPVNIPAWRAFPLLDATRTALARLGSPVPITLVGDGIAMTAAEHAHGAARGADNALCMVVSTGVGGGLVLGGRLHTGPTGNAGHIGHITVDHEGPPCPCGSRGCLETIASGTAIAAWAHAHGFPTDRGRPAGAEALATAARARHPLAEAAFERAGKALAAAIAATATLVDLDTAVIGGGVGQAGDVLLDPVRRHLPTYAALDFAREITVVRATLGTTAGLVGAAAAAREAAGSGT
ncbi:ROK family protein (plasmid) [Streptomyces sp. BI20]|uniref:ROK family protein n=1 Tax=Streptomyces sp. BI20 TaxID=3403460 RepID=UPI003C793104